MKVAIVGSRTYNNYDQAFSVLEHMIEPDDVIISGGAHGADAIAKDYALEKGYAYVEYKADWDKYGKSAGMIRNGKIVEECDYVIAFWDGKSSGTKDTIQKARNNNKEAIIIDV